MSLDQKLDRVLERYKELAESLIDAQSLPSQEFVRLSKEYSDLTPIAEAITALHNIDQQRDELQTLLGDGTLDSEMRTMAQQELEQLNEQRPSLEKQVKILLLPKDDADERNAIIEIRAGTGGDEAALFGADLLRMYQRYAELKRWKWEIISLSDTGIGGIKEAIASISGKGVFSRLKYESGVHRVQRVPLTETQGRIHTSAATVAVLPEAEEVDIHIDEKDLRIDVYRSSGPGGQHVNTTDSAVRITHLPTGVVVAQQDEKSQHKNKAKALKVLRARLYEFERSKREAERAAARKSQVGSGDRSERIRTYNFPQGRVTDHRINLTLYKIEAVLDGSALDDFVEALVEEDQASHLASLD